MENIYYVYEWIRLDTNEPFYVGKGHGNRWKDLYSRNKHFNNIVNSIPVAVNILHDNLDEQMAYDLECWYIWQCRDITGYNLCNINDGGEGQSLCGENHYLYGKGYLIMGENNPNYGNGDKIKGKNNPMYGKNYRDYMTEEAKREHDRKISEANKGKLAGENNPMYGKYGKDNPNYGRKHSQEAREKMRQKAIGRKHSQEAKKKMSEKRKGKHEGKDSLIAKSVICLTTEKIFFSANMGAKYYGCDNSSLIRCCKGKGKHCGRLQDGTLLKWMYLSDFLEKCKYTIL